MNDLAYDETFSCVQCGYCLPVCPTFVTMGKETHSPRGRINLVKMAAEGKITYEQLREPIELCLGCRACEVVCPTNVQYGKILDAAKIALKKEEKEQRTKRVSLFREFVFAKAIRSKTALSMFSSSLAFYQKTGVQKVAEKTRALNLLPKHLKTFAEALPAVEGPFARRKRSNENTIKEPMYKIGFFTGCLMDVMFSRINTLSIKLLEATGCDVKIIQDEACCGALHQHNGEVDAAKQLAKQNIMSFEQHDFDYIVNSIGGCGAMLHEYERLFTNDHNWRKRAKDFSKKVIDISILLQKVPLTFTKQLEKTVTYQPSCHLTNVQNVADEPINLLQAIPGLTYKELPQNDFCCGSAGDYNLAHFEESMDILDHKMEHVQTMTPLPEIIVTSNPGCHLQMRIGVEREGLTTKTTVVHLVELLAEACEISI